MSKSVAESTAVLNTARGIAKPGYTPYLALFVGNPLAGGVEVVGNAYARRQVFFGVPPGNYSMSNNVAIAFPTPTGAWGGAPLTHAALMDAATGGTVREVYILGGTDIERTVNASTPAITLAIGTLVLTEL